MAMQGAKAEVNTFVKGIITEASPLIFPPNATADEQNFELNRDGTRERRLGFDRESISNYPITEVGGTAVKHNVFRWKNVNGSASKEFIVVQVSSILYFYDPSPDSILQNNYFQSIDLSGSEIDLNTFSGLNKWSFASVDGVLVVAGGCADIAIIRYDAAANKLFKELVRIKVRDVWGVPFVESYNTTTGTTTYDASETDPLFRPSTKSNAHLYNLMNQSWGIPRRDKAGVLGNPIVTFHANTGNKFPSHSDTVWTALRYTPATGTEDPKETLTPKLWEDLAGAVGEAARGHFVIDLLFRSGSRQEELSKRNTVYPSMFTDYPELLSVGLATDRTTGGAKIVAEYAGRIFYAGFDGDNVYGSNEINIRVPSFQSYVFFSQLVIGRDKIHKCYQAGDPTSRDGSDVVATDGGFVKMDGAKQILNLVPFGAGLIVIASNGVWKISGGADEGFTAANYKVTKISDVGALSGSSVVQEEGKIFYWSPSGICAVGMDKMGDVGVEIISKQTIQTLYDQIPLASKQDAIGCYDPVSKKVRWVYRTGTYGASASVTYELILDTLLGAFYIHRLYKPANFNIDVVGAIEHVQSEFTGTGRLMRKSSLSSLKYLVRVNDVAAGTTKMYFCKYKDTDFCDFKSFGGSIATTDAKAYFYTGTMTGGDSASKKQVPYLTMHFKRTETAIDETGVVYGKSSAKVRTMWDWSYSGVSKKWGSLFQAYRYRRPFITETSMDTGFDTIVTKNRIRGMGKSFGMYLETEAGHDCRLLGWSLILNATTA